MGRYTVGAGVFDAGDHQNGLHFETGQTDLGKVLRQIGITGQGCRRVGQTQQEIWHEPQVLLRSLEQGARIWVRGFDGWKLKAFIFTSICVVSQLVDPVRRADLLNM